MNIIDSFTFYNEMTLLKYRINVLYDIVDYFIIVESTHTFMGNPKKLYFKENKDNFKKFEDKIIHIVVDDFPHKQPNINIKKNEQWINENYQRKQIERGIEKIDIGPKDIIIVSDLDEIPNPNILTNIKKGELKVNILRLEMDFYYYNLYSRFKEKWDKAIMFSFEKKQKYDFDYNYPRNNIKGTRVKNAGWHLSYFGDSKFINNKIKEFAHQEYNNDNYNNLGKIERKIKDNDDLFSRTGSKIEKILIENNNNLPVNYDKYLTDFF
jgi:beta-1,4-mannosyl-glycoprotein beta-1,4-N-acetylglucosaminyltransferase